MRDLPTDRTALGCPGDVLFQPVCAKGFWTEPEEK